MTDVLIKADKNKFFFTNKKPCNQYLFSEFCNFIFQELSPALKRPVIKETVTLSQIEEAVKDFIEKKGNGLVKPKESWVRHSIAFFAKLKWLKITAENKIEVSLEKFRTHKEKDFIRFFSKTLCKMDKQEELKVKKKEIKKEDKSKQLNLFSRFNKKA